MLKAYNLSHKFDYTLFENISLEIKPSQKIAITGVSGSGKSTLLHILSTFIKPNSGRVEIFGKDMYKLSSKELLKIRRFEIGIVFQFHYLFNGFSGYENIFISSLLSNNEIDEELLYKLKIKDVIYQNISSLSGGQQQRVSIARVLTKKPKIIFADEPTGNLDTNTANEVMDIFSEYCDKNNASLVLVTHEKNIANQCDTIYELKDKKLWEL